MKTTVVALDIGSTHLRAVEARLETGKSFKTLRVHQVPLPTGVVSSGLIAQPSLLRDAIKALWKGGRFQSKRVITMATGDAYDNRVISDLPWAHREDAKRLLPHQLRDRTPLETEDYYFDSHTLREYYKDDQRRLYTESLVIGVNKAFADEVIASLESCGLLPVGMDVFPLALIRSYLLNSHEASTNRPVVSVDIGSEITTIVAHVNSQPIYINSAAPLGGERITSAIAKELRCTQPEAEMIKRSFRFSDEERERASATTFLESGETRVLEMARVSERDINSAETIIAREVSNIIVHITDILEDAFSTQDQEPLEIVLSGGGSLTFGIVDRIAAEVGVPTRYLGPFPNTLNKHVPSDPAESYAAVYGLLVGQENN